MRIERASNYPLKHIPHGACCARLSAGVVWSCLGFRKWPKPYVDRKLPKHNWVLRYDLTPWLISPHVGSLFKFWRVHILNFYNVTWLTRPLRLILVVRSGWGLGSKLAQFRYLFHNIQMEIEPASNRPQKHIPHGACCVGETSQHFLAFFSVSANVFPLVVENSQPEVSVALRLDSVTISPHVGSLFKFWLCTYWIFTIVTRLASPSRLILVEGSGWGLGLKLAQFPYLCHNIQIKIEPASNRPQKHIPHGACCVGETSQHFLAFFRFPQMFSPWSLKIANPKWVLRYELIRWLSLHMWDRYSNFDCAHIEFLQS